MPAVPDIEVRAKFDTTTMFPLLAIVAFGRIVYAAVALINSPIRSRIWTHLEPAITTRLP